MLNKAINSGKEHRKPYTSRSLRRYGHYAMSCMRHNPKQECPYCRDNRLYHTKVRILKSVQDLKDYRYEQDL